MTKASEGHDTKFGNARSSRSIIFADPAGSAGILVIPMNASLNV